MIEPPKEYLEAWQQSQIWAERYKGIAPSFGIEVREKLADAFVWSLAALDRSEFYREHHRDETYCHECQQRDFALQTLIGRYDPRHTWDDAMFQQARRTMLEVK